MSRSKQFIFLYPIPEIIDFEIKNWEWSWKGGKEAFRKKYSHTLNRCINIRYRKKGFRINYAIFDDCSVSEVINLQSTDRIIKVGLDFKTHTTKQPNGKYPYPDYNYLLDCLKGLQVIRIAGFHMWDCVEKVARRAYEKKLDVLVDEDLTEFFAHRLSDREFRVGKYPTYNARKHQGLMFDDFINARKQRPWLWQDY